MLLAAVSHHLTGIDYLVVAIFLLGLLGMGVYFSRQQTSSEEYFIGRRQFPSFIVGISIVATLLSTITYLAAPGEMIQYGLAFATQILALPFWLLVVVVFWVPFFMRYRLTSIYEYIELRFGYRTRLLAASLFILMRFGWMGMIIYTAGRAVADVTSNLPGLFEEWTTWSLSADAWLVCVILSMGIIATAYTFLGGIRVVIWTDVIQFTIMIGGAALAIAYVWWQTDEGPAVWWSNASSLARAEPIWFSTDLQVERTVFLVCLNAFFWRVCTHCADQVATQRYFSTKNSRAALVSNVVGALGDFLLMIVLGTVGLALLTFFSPEFNPDITAGTGPFGGVFDPSDPDDAKSAFPAFIVSYLPPGISGLIMAALFAAAMSSIDSGMNSISAVVTVDFYRRWNQTSQRGDREMVVARYTTLLTGVAVTGVALFVARVLAVDPANQNIVDLSIRVFNLFLGPLAAMFMAGIFLPRVSSSAVVWATLAGIVLAVLLSFWKDLTGAADSPPALLVTPLSTLGTVLLAGLFGLLLPAPAAERLAGHTWATRREIVEPPDA